MFRGSSHRSTSSPSPLWRLSLSLKDLPQRDLTIRNYNWSTQDRSTQFNHLIFYTRGSTKSIKVTKLLVTRLQILSLITSYKEEYRLKLKEACESRNQVVESMSWKPKEISFERFALENWKLEKLFSFERNLIFKVYMAQNLLFNSNSMTHLYCNS